VASLVEREATEACARLQKEFGDRIAFVPEHGNLFVPTQYAQRSRAELLGDPKSRSGLLRSLYEDFEAGLREQPPRANDRPPSPRSHRRLREHGDGFLVPGRLRRRGEGPRMDRRRWLRSRRAPPTSRRSFSRRACRSSSCTCACSTARRPSTARACT
jgi:hypothetical protein